VNREQKNSSMQMNTAKTHKDLLIWQKSMDLSVLVYKITNTFPKEELYGITSQMRRASVSIPSNIAEGYGRFSDKEFVRFLFISLGSASELETQIDLSLRLGFISEDNHNTLNKLVQETLKMLIALIKYKNKIINQDS